MIFGWKHERRVKRLEDELDETKRQVRSLSIEWESVYNKMRAILARFNKREERAADAPDHHAAEPLRGGAGNGASASRQWDLAQLAARGHEQ
jgi:hypothetical protein